MLQEASKETRGEKWTKDVVLLHANAEVHKSCITRVGGQYIEKKFAF